MTGLIMKAFLQGFAGLVTAFFDKAKKQGFSIMLLVVVAGILLWRSLSVETACEKKVERLEIKIESINKSWSAALNVARTDWYKCDSLRQAQAVRLESQAGEIAYLKSEVRFLKSQR